MGDTNERKACAGLRILVVDDDKDNADSLALLLRVAGHEAEACTDSESALGMAAALRPQVMFLDLGMPRLDGFEVARRVRSDLADPPYLIAFTGHAEEAARRRSLEAGIDTHLVKPADPVQILTLVSDLRTKG